MTDANANEKTGVGLPVGTKIGKYEVRERLGSGGQAIVYRCHDSFLDRDVAIKQISSHLAEDPKFMARFRREAQILARLGGDVITVHELIEDERGLFIVMEYVEGHSLETILQETNGPVEVKAALQILWRLAATLNEVHSAGVIHRDLKPTNIIIAEGLHPRITDFGVAAGASGQTSMVLGTTKYLAPEMYEGVPADARCDIYSLGFILYEMLAGRPRFNEIFHDVVRDPHSAAMRWMKWHGNRNVTAPALSEINPDVPESLSDIIAKMMAKDPQERFESTEALGRAIKSAFSPKARAAATAQAAETKLVREGRRAARTKATGAAEFEGEGDELEFGAEDAAATAPLPKAGMSLRTKLILGGIIVAGFVGIVSVLVYQSHVTTTEMRKAARFLYRDADGLYEKDKYAEAMEGFEKLGAPKYRGTQQAAKASVMVHFCKARLAVLQASAAHREHKDAKALWEQAAEAEQAAREQVKKVQAYWSDKQYEDWTRDRLGDLNAFGLDRTNARDFVQRIVRAKDFFGDSKHALALGELADLESQLPLSDPQREEARLLRRKIERAEFKTAIDEEIGKGELLVRDGKLLEAERAYKRALAQVEADDAGVLTRDETKAYRDDLEAKIRSLQARQSYDKLMAEADAARRDGNKEAELEALKQARQKRPSGELAARILNLESDLAVQRGREILSQKAPNYLADARREFEKAVKLNGNAAAKAELEALDIAEKRKGLITEADSLAAADKFDDAMKKYEEALKLGADQSLTDKMSDCRFRGHFSRAEALRKAGKFDAAAEEYHRAAAAKPDEQARIDAEIAAMRQQEQYDKSLAAGDAALKAGDYAKARGHFQKAKAVTDTPEVRERLITVEYREYLERGKAAMSRKDYRVALAHFKLARKYRETDEIKKLIAEAQRLLEATSSKEARLSGETQKKKASRKRGPTRRWIVLRLSL